jgi:HPt (histidine-containing phosphotransfer) domain-containing protein
VQLTETGPGNRQHPQEAVTEAPVDGMTFDALVASVGGGDEGRAFVEELVGDFVEDAPAQLASLRTAIDVGDASEARRAAHTLKSNGATLGALRFSGLCRDLELLVGEGAFEATPALVAEAELEWGRVREALEGASR